MECRIGLHSNQLTNKDCMIGCITQPGFGRYPKRDLRECIMKQPWECPACDTRPACPSSEWGVAVPVVVDRRSLSAPGAADPTAGSAVLRNRRESAHRYLHCPGFLSPSPRPSPGSSACKPCQLMNGPSWH